MASLGADAPRVPLVPGGEASHLMFICAATLWVLAAAPVHPRKLEDPRPEEESAPGLALVEVVLGAGGSREVDGSSPRVPYLFSSVLLGMTVSRQLGLELSYGLSTREGWGPTHVGGLTSYLFPRAPLMASLSLFVSPPGHRVEDTYCLPMPTERRCVGAEERLAYVSSRLLLEYATGSERDVEGWVAVSVEPILYRLQYRIVASELEGTRLSIPLREYRFGLEGGVELGGRLELGLRSRYTLFFVSEAPDAEHVSTLHPTELPLAPSRFELGPRLTVTLGRGVETELSASYAPYIERCFGQALFGSVRLTAHPGRFRLFGQLDHRRDRSPRDAPTLEYCGEEEPFPDYVSTTATVGVGMFF